MPGTTGRRRDTSRTAPWPTALALFEVLLRVAGLVVGCGFGSWVVGSWIGYFLWAFAALRLLARCDGATTSISHSDTTVELVSGFRRTSIEKKSIAGVSWEKGSGPI